MMSAVVNSAGILERPSWLSSVADTARTELEKVVSALAPGEESDVASTSELSSRVSRAPKAGVFRVNRS